MNNLKTEVNSVQRLNFAKRKIISSNQENLIELKFLKSINSLPLVISPAIKGLDLLAWAKKNQEFIEIQLLKYGGIIFRNFQLYKVEEFQHFLKTTSTGELLDYTYRSSPRTQVEGKIYTSTEYPADQSIPLHNENSYSTIWPMKIYFLCLKSAEKGGETPIADSRKVFERIDPAIKERFIQKQVMYVRNYGELDLSWQDVFQTKDKFEVERYCCNLGIEVEWRGSNNLRTRQVCQAVAQHPKTGEMVWFNQAHLFHVSSLKAEVRESLLSLLKEDELPRNAYYGDGSPIETSVLDEIRKIYDEEAIYFSWREGDILMLDNMLTAHGRLPFTGTRKVVVGMAEPC